ncbi:hypothetical protein D9758_004155 [Tetrapyrgos nigripes]|uniref:Uncharacterized protein n=1 Tax=Tetrapyrgos nigripes TaxID=182062 RepID=A0A8H5LVM9_9AGAR|nr:hypothetical protein D9758_004155 [Tetrapyrgos nigripes]
MSARPLTDRENRLLRFDGEFAMESIPGLILEGALWEHTPCSPFMPSILSGEPSYFSSSDITKLSTSILLFKAKEGLKAQNQDSLYYLVQIKYDNLVIGAPDETASDKAITPEFLVMRAFFGEWLIMCLQLLVGDAVVLWRTWVLWQNQQVFMAVPCLFWLGSFGSQHSLHSTSSTAPLKTFLATNGPNDPLPSVLQLSNWILSIMTNVICSAMMGYKLQHRRMLHKHSGSSRSQTLKILSVMQSGLVYLVVMGIMVMSLIVSTDYGPVNVFMGVLNKLSDQIIGLYPTIVIILVEFQRQVWDREKEESSNSNDLPKHGAQALRLSTLQFASRPRGADPAADDVIANDSTNMVSRGETSAV